MTRLGDANWRLVDGLVQADLGGKDASYLVSKQSYDDFQMRAEFWVDSDANSGIFIRVQNPAKIGADSSYEVNVFDKRPDPSYGTGGIPNVAPTLVPLKAGGQWNVYEITAKGPQLTIVLNGIKTVDVVNGYSGRTPVSFTTRAHFTSSALIKPANCSGVSAGSS